MKSKNILLMGIAVGCGLVAAYLTAKMSSAPVESVEVIVAKAELPQGTDILTDKDGVEKQLAVKTFPKGTEPAAFIRDIEFLKGKKLNKTLRAGDHFTEGDLTTKLDMNLPKGRTACAVKVTEESAVAGLIEPGSRVHVVFAEGCSGVGGQKRSAILLKNMMVVAVNQTIVRQESGPQGVNQPRTATLAVSPKEAAILALAQKRGELSLILLDPKANKEGRIPPLAEVKDEDLDFEPIVELPFEKKEEAKPTIQLPPTVDVWVSTTDLPAGTKIDDPTGYFKRKPMLEKPTNCLEDITKLKGVVLTKPVFKDQFVPLAALEGKYEEPKDRVVIKTVIAPPPPPPPAPVLTTLTVTNGGRSTYYQYDQTTNRLTVPTPSAPTDTAAPKPTVEEKKPTEPAAAVEKKTDE